MPAFQPASAASSIDHTTACPSARIMSYEGCTKADNRCHAASGSSSGVLRIRAQCFVATGCDAVTNRNAHGIHRPTSRRRKSSGPQRKITARKRFSAWLATARVRPARAEICPVLPNEPPRRGSPRSTCTTSKLDIYSRWARAVPTKQPRRLPNAALPLGVFAERIVQTV